MLKGSQYTVPLAEIPLSPLGTRHVQITADLDRRDVDARLEAMHVQIHRERRTEFYRNLITLWPMALGIAIAFCAPSLRDAAAGYAPWAAKLLFPLSFLASQHDVHLGADAMPTVSEAMLYAQFVLDGILASVLLRKGSGILSVCGQLALFHVLFMISIGFMSGSFNGFLTN